MKRWRLGKISRTCRQEKTFTCRVRIVLSQVHILLTCSAGSRTGQDLCLIFPAFKGYDEPEILPSSIRQICSIIGAESGQIRGG